METNISINKIVSILIAIIVASCVLIPICNELGSNGNGGGDSNSGRSATILNKMAYWGTEYGGGVPGEYSYIYDLNGETDEWGNYSLNSWVINDGMNYNIRFVPGHDGLTYTDGEIVMLSYYAHDTHNLVDCGMITYSNNKFIFTGFNDDLECVGFVLGIVQSGPGSSDCYIVPLDSVDDTEMKTEYDNNAIYILGSGIVKVHDEDYDGRTYYVTDNPNVSIPLDEVVNVYEDGYIEQIFKIWYANTNADIPYVASSIVANLDGSDVNSPLCEYIEQVIGVVEDSDDENLWDKLEQNTIKPISINKWNDWDVSDDEKFEANLLIFNSEVDYTLDGGNGNSGNSGIAGTLITIIPVFVLLAILGSIAYMFVGRNEIAE